MKIAITGHTKGIGKACADLFRHHTIYGYSRSNGYDINEPEEIFKSAEDCDVFINNAYSHRHQIDLFNLFYDSWEHTDKHIINVNSIVKYPIQKPVLEKYKKDKVALQNAVDDVYLGAKAHGSCKVTNINPGLVATRSDVKYTHPALDPIEVAKTIQWCVEQDFNVYDITISK